MKNKSLIRGKPSEHMLSLTGFLVFKAGQLVEDKFTEHFGTGKVKARHFATLRVLHFEDSLNQQQLCESLWIDRATMTQIIRELMNLKFVKRVTKEGDRRSFLISMTAAGRKYYLEHAALFSKLDECIFGAMNPLELKRLQTSLRNFLIGIAEK